MNHTAVDPELRPDEAAETVDRPRIVDRLASSRRARLVVLAAPAGYSKTTTLQSWDLADRRRFLWVNCDRRHTDPSFFAVCLARALMEVAPVDQETADALSIEASWPELALERLGTALEGCDASFALVIDDAHVLSGTGSSEILRGLLDVLPAGGQLVLGTRTTPPFGLGRLRANGLLVELGASDLAMTRGESLAVLRKGGLSLGDDQLDLIHDRTEGWPAALHLATLALAGRDDEDRALAEFAGDDRGVTEYLQDEFLASSDPSDVEFMTKTSILEVLSGPACDALLDRPGSSAVLERLASSNALIVPLDRSRTRYRYHHLFADMLRRELQLNMPEAIPALHAKAARWYERDAELELAVEHALTSGDLCLAGQLIWRVLPELISRGRTATLRRWLDGVGEERLTECPGLLFSIAHVSLASGSADDAAHWLGIASRLQAKAGCPIDVEAGLSMLETIVAVDGAQAMLKSADRALDQQEPGAPWSGAAFFYRGAAYSMLSDWDAAERDLREAARTTAQSAPLMQTLALAQLAINCWHRGDRDGALRLAREARAQTERCGLTELPVVVMVHAVDSMVLASSGQTDRARESMQTSRRLLASLQGFPFWYASEARLSLAEATLLLGDPKGATELVEGARDHLAPVSDAPILREWLEAQEARLRTSAQATADITRLTAAEMRTLRFLPTHLSFKLIGEYNHVSTNTVKTQARAIYTKLGASSRAEAVERARELGLLAGPDPPV